MKTLAYCWTCNKEHDITNKGIKEYGIKCDCGGYVISPSGKINMKLVPENDEDKKILGIRIEKIETGKPLPKVFKMDDYSWVCAMDIKKAVSWYIETTGVEEEDLEVKECDLDDNTMYSETSISEIVEKLESMNNQDETSFSIIRRSGELFIKESFRDVINFMIDKSGYESIVAEPFEICSTEW